jgi:hypothetical protein
VTAVLDVPADAPPRTGSTRARARPARTHRHRSAVWALARVEGRRLVRNPLFLLATAGGVAMFVALTWRQAPRLQLDDILSAAALLPVAAATFLVADLAAFRGKRHDTDELYEAMATPRQVRTAAHLLSVAWAVGVAFLVMVVEGGYLAALRPVGSPNPFELLTGPAVVGVLGCIGVALGTWWRSAFLAPVCLVALAGASLFADLRSGPRATPARWLSPWVPAPAAPELLIRPAALHFLYLLALIAAACALAILRHRRDRGARLVALAAAALVLVSGVAATRPPSAAARASLARLVETPAAFEVCRSIDDVRYCAYPGYRGWIDRWSRVVQGTLGPVPAASRPRGLEVRQVAWAVYDSDLPLSDLARFSTGKMPAPALRGTITPGTEWGRAAWAGASDLGLGLQVATRVLGDPIGSPIGDSGRMCRTNGQAAGVVAIWLAGQATPEAGPALRAVLAQDPFEIDVTFPTGGSSSSAATSSFSYTGPMQWDLNSLVYRAAGSSLVDWGKAEANYAAQLLARPARDVTAVLRSHWDELTNPATRTGRLVRLFGLHPLTSIREQLLRAGQTPSQVREFLHNFATGSHVCP